MAVRDTLVTDLQLVGTGVYTSGFFSIARSIERAADRLDDFNTKQVLFATAGILVATKTIKFLKDAVLEAGNLQAKQQAFTTLFRGNSQAADQFIGSLQDFAITSSFTFNQTATLTQSLVAMGFAADETIPIMRRLGDATAALGGEPEKLDRLVLAIGQIRTRGKLVQQELNQLSQAGFPVADLLDRMGLTGTQKGNIGREGIESAIALKAIFELIDDRFAGAMEKRLTTIPGQIEQIKDAWETFLRITGMPFATPVVESLKFISSGLIAINQQGETAGKIVAGLSMGTLLAIGIKGGMMFRNFLKGGGIGGELARGAVASTLPGDLTKEQRKAALSEGLKSIGFGGGNVGVMNVTAGVVNVLGGGGAAGLAGAAASALGGARGAAAAGGVGLAGALASGSPRAIEAAQRARMMAEPWYLGAGGSVSSAVGRMPHFSSSEGARAYRESIGRMGFFQRMGERVTPGFAANALRFGAGGGAAVGGFALRGMAQGVQDPFMSMLGTVGSDALLGAGLGFMATGNPAGALIGGAAGGVAGIFDAIFSEQARTREAEDKLAAARDKDTVDALNKIAANTSSLKNLSPNTLRMVAGGKDVYRPLPGALITLLSNAKI